ncbi:hypothetical protein [Amycolatopsis stemonae]
MLHDPRTRKAEPFNEFQRNLDELIRQTAAARRQGRSPNDATLDLLQVLHRRDHAWAVVHLAFAVAALAHHRTFADAASTPAASERIQAKY